VRKQFSVRSNEEGDGQREEGEREEGGKRGVELATHRRLTRIPPRSVRAKPAWKESSERSPRKKLLILEEGERKGSWLEEGGFDPNKEKRWSRFTEADRPFFRR